MGGGKNNFVLIVMLGDKFVEVFVFGVIKWVGRFVY